MLDAEHNDFVEQVDQLNTFVRGITTASGQLRNQSAATAQSLVGAQRFVATASQTVFVTTIVYSASFTATNVEVFSLGVKIDTSLVTVANASGFLQVTIPSQIVTNVVFVAAYESGAGLLVRMANTASASDGANMIGVQDTGALIAATTVEGALTEIVTSLNLLLTNLGTTSDLWRRTGTNAATANIPMGGFKFTGMADGSAATDSATTGQVSALNTAISGLGATFIRKDGSGAMTGIFNAGNFKVQNVAAPVAGTDAANKTYVDAQLGSAAPAGAIMAFGGAVAPTGWLLCNGAAVSRTTYATLFAVAGTTYGAGDGTTTFNVPNLQGRFPIGAGTGSQKNVASSGVITGGTALAGRTIGQFGGEEDHVLLVSELAQHSHVYRWGTSAGGGPGPDGEAPIGDNNQSAATDTAGTNVAHNTTPSFVVVSYIIKT